MLHFDDASGYYYITVDQGIFENQPMDDYYQTISGGDY